MVSFSPIQTSMIQAPVITPQAASFAYDAVDGQAGKRKSPTGILRSEDAELPPERRKLLVSQTRDLHRNFAVAGWMIRQHLNYVASFVFEAKTEVDGKPDEVFNDQLETCMRNWSVASQCDIAKRMSLMQIIRTLECRASLDGDCGLLKIRSGRLQGIEGDRVRTPYGGIPADLRIVPENVMHGIETDGSNAAVSYLVCRRSRASDIGSTFQNFQFERRVMARDMLWHGYFDRFDQVRGIPPITPAVNVMIDLYEGMDYALARMKVEQLLGLFIKRGAIDGGTDDEDPTDYSKIRLGKQPFTLVGDPGDEAEFLSSSNPSMQFQAFIQWLMQICLKCFDIPFSFFSENFTNYSGARQAWLQYDISCEPKRSALRDVLNQITAWIVEIWMQDGLLPRRPIESIKWDWVSVGMPWIDPLKEVQGDLSALSGALDSRTDICRRSGRNWRDIARKLSAENAFLAKLGLPVAITPDAALVQAMLTEASSTQTEAPANAAV